VHLGFFSMPLHPPGTDFTQSLDSDLEQIITLDELGYHEAWLGEHFTSVWENIPAPDLVIFGHGHNERIDAPDGIAVYEGAIRWFQKRFPRVEFLFCQWHHSYDNANIPPVPERRKLCEHYGIPFIPNSGFRCLELNRAIGSSDRSQHTTGEAVDFEVPGISNREVALWVKENCKFDQLILEFYKEGDPSSGWVHCSYVIEGENRKSARIFDGTNWSDLV